MTFKRACYSYSALHECAEKVNAASWTVQRKAEHVAKCFEIGRLFDFCFEATDCSLFEADYSPWETYHRLIVLDDNAKRRTGLGNVSKKELDEALKTCRRYLCNEISGIRAMMDAGEVDTKD